MLLTNRTVVLTRDPVGNRAWARTLANSGATLYRLPSISLESAPLTPELTQTLTNLRHYDWLVFTSAAGVRQTHHLLDQLGVKSSANPPSVAVVGARTAKAATSAGWPVAFRPATANAATLAATLPNVDQRRVLLLRTTIAGPELGENLRRRGATVTEVSVYNTRLRDDPDPAFVSLLRAGHVHYLTFASPSAVHGFIQRLSATLAEDLKTAQTLPAVATGPTTAIALRQAGFTNVHQAAQPTVQAVRTMLLELTR